MHSRNDSPSPKRSMSTRTLAYCALLAAISVVLARLIIPMPNASTRFSIEAVPIFLSGMLFGPLAGGLVGFSSDLVGCLFSGYGYNPLFCLPPILYGVFAGLARRWLGKDVSILKLVAALLPPTLLGSVLWQSAALAFVYNSKGSFLPSFVFFLSTRTVQFAITLVLNAMVLFLLFRANIFSRLRVWPPQDMGTDTKN